MWSTPHNQLVESIKERVDARGASGYIAAAAHRDAMDRLRELAERLEEEHGAVLAAVAGREAAQGAQATVFTSDTDDMNQLLVGHSVRVEKA
ncbi:hypothetical protein G3I77_15010 [Streptomyces sp. D2-8]|nr:hypothetical protein [Streptomyces sp. D2-8]